MNTLMDSNITFADDVKQIKVGSGSGLGTKNFFYNGSELNLTKSRFSDSQYNIAYPFIPNYIYKKYEPNIISTVPKYNSNDDNGLSQSLTYTIGSDNSYGGAERYMEFRVKASKDLEGSIQNISISTNKESFPSIILDSYIPPLDNNKYNKIVSPTVNTSQWKPELKKGGNSGTFNDSDNTKVFIANKYIADSNGGTATINIKLKGAKFLNNDSKIYTYVASNSLYPGGANYSLAYHPVYEALRIFGSDQLNPNNDYNKKVLEDEMKDPYIKEIEDHYNSIINEIPSKFPVPPYNQDSINDYKKRLTEDKDKGIADITNATHAMEASGNYDDAIFDYFKNTASSTINKMNNEEKPGKLPPRPNNLLQINSVPNLEFGTHLIWHNDMTYDLSSVTNVSITDINYKKWNLDLSISDLNSDNNILNNSYVMNGKKYSSNEIMPYYSYNEDKSDAHSNINITKKPDEYDNIHMNVPYDNMKGDYHGVAHWQLTSSPI
ncbi:hypothetical protein [Apilactobacillus micheneri]|uniref:hypothetical protein n=2 Tax=Apilactobacillus micheneri TaxID=1899430 RepID=UPI00112DA05A|nr:hypothetical protein [Apilactobacillus micheneri]